MKNRTNRTLTAVLAALMCLSPLLGSCGGKGEGGESGSTGGGSGKAFGSDSKIGIITEMCYAASKDILSDGEMRDITGLVSVRADTLTVDGTVIRTVGKEARGTNDKTPPAMMPVLKPAE